MRRTNDDNPPSSTEPPTCLPSDRLEWIVELITRRSTLQLLGEILDHLFAMHSFRSS